MSRAESAATVVLVLAAVATAAAVVSRAVSGPVSTAALPEPPEISAAQLARAESVSFSFGDSVGDRSITVFSDMQCPACRQLHAVLRQLERESEAGLQLRFVHYPLDYHAQARVLARLVECSDDELERSMRLDRAFALQDSVGRLSSEEIAKAIVGVGGDAEQCLSASSDDSRFWRIQSGRALGDEVRILGTPTVIVNGRIFGGRPTLEALRSELGYAQPQTATPR